MLSAGLKDQIIWGFSVISRGRSLQKMGVKGRDEWRENDRDAPAAAVSPELGLAGLSSLSTPGAAEQKCLKLREERQAKHLERELSTVQGVVHFC